MNQSSLFDSGSSDDELLSGLGLGLGAAEKKPGRTIKRRATGIAVGRSATKPNGDLDATAMPVATDPGPRGATVSKATSTAIYEDEPEIIDGSYDSDVELLARHREPSRNRHFHNEYHTFSEAEFQNQWSEMRDQLVTFKTSIDERDRRTRWWVWLELSLSWFGGVVFNPTIHFVTK